MVALRDRRGLESVNVAYKRSSQFLESRTVLEQLERRDSTSNCCSHPPNLVSTLSRFG